MLWKQVYSGWPMPPLLFFVKLVRMLTVCSSTSYGRSKHMISGGMWWWMTISTVASRFWIHSKRTGLNVALDPVCIWNFIPYYTIILRFDGVNFILDSDYNTDKLPERLSLFHKQVLLAWSLRYQDNFTPQKYLIWNNRNTSHENQSLFFSNWL